MNTSPTNSHYPIPSPYKMSYVESYEPVKKEMRLQFKFSLYHQAK